MRSVRRIEDEAPVTMGDTGALIEARRVGRPAVAAPWAALIAAWLEQDRVLPSGEVVRRLREEHGYAGGKSAVYELVRRLAPMVRFEGAPAEFSQHDFGHVDVRYTPGQVERGSCPA